MISLVLVLCLIVHCSFGTSADSIQCYDFEGDKEWITHEFWVGVGATGSQQDTTYFEFKWDPHFKSATDQILDFCEKHGCDLNSKLLIRNELIRRVREGASSSHRELLLFITNNLLKNSQKNQKTLLGQTDGTIGKQHAFKGEIIEAVLSGVLLPPTGNCINPSGVQVAIGACPLFTAQETLLKHTHLAIRVINVLISINSATASSDSPNQVGDEVLESYLVPKSSNGWIILAEAWFNSQEYALAASIYLYLLEVEKDMHGKQHAAAAAAGDAVVENNQPKLPKDIRLLPREKFLIDQGLATISASWGLQTIAESLLIAATLYAEDPIYLLKLHDEASIQRKLFDYSFMHDDSYDDAQTQSRRLHRERYRYSLLNTELGITLTEDPEQEQRMMDYSHLSKIFIDLIEWEEGCTKSTASALRVKASLYLPPIIISSSSDTILVMRKKMQCAAQRLVSTSTMSSSTLELKLPLYNSVTDPMVEIGATFFHLAHQGLVNIELNRAIGRVLLYVSPQLNYVAPQLLNPPSLRTSTGERGITQHLLYGHKPNTSFMVGIVSNHLFEHSIGKMMAIVFIEMRNRGIRFHICDQISPGSSRADHVWQFMMENVVDKDFHGGHTLLPNNFSECLKVIASLSLDILLYPDVGMEPLSYFLSFTRLAPLQLVWWGHPDTTPGQHIDYYLSLDDELDRKPNTDMYQMDNENLDVKRRSESMRSKNNVNSVFMSTSSGDEHYREQLIRADWINTAQFLYEPLPYETVEITSKDDADSHDVASVKRQVVNEGYNTCHEGDTYHSFGLSLCNGTVVTKQGFDVLKLACFPESVENRPNPTSMTTSIGVSSMITNNHLNKHLRQYFNSSPHIFMILGRLFKFHPNFDQLLIEILYKDPKAVIVLIQERQYSLTNQIYQRIRESIPTRVAELLKKDRERPTKDRKDELNQENRHICDLFSTFPSVAMTEAVDKASFDTSFSSSSQTFLSHCSIETISSSILNRFRFISHWNYLRVMGLPQLYGVLDTWPYGGCLTALEALSHGRLVITLPSVLVRGRFTLAMYRQMGILSTEQTSYLIGSDAYATDHHHGPSSSSSPISSASIVYNEKVFGSDSMRNASKSTPPPPGLVAVSEQHFVDSVVAIATSSELRIKLTRDIRNLYNNGLHQNVNSGEEWANLFTKLHAMHR